MINFIGIEEESLNQSLSNSDFANLIKQYAESLEFKRILQIQSFYKRMSVDTTGAQSPKHTTGDL